MKIFLSKISNLNQKFNCQAKKQPNRKNSLCAGKTTKDLKTYKNFTDKYNIYYILTWYLMRAHVFYQFKAGEGSDK